MSNLSRRVTEYLELCSTRYVRKLEDLTEQHLSNWADAKSNGLSDFEACDAAAVAYELIAHLRQLESTAEFFGRCDLAERAWWDSIAREHILSDDECYINTAAYKYIMQGRYGVTDERQHKLDKKDSTLESLTELISTQSLTATEISKLSNACAAIAKAESVATLTSRVAALEQQAESADAANDVEQVLRDLID